MDVVCQQAAGVAKANWYALSSLPLLPLTLISPLISHPLAGAFEEEFSHDLKSAKTHLEVEVESRKTSARKNEAPKAAEIARVRIQRELAELCEECMRESLHTNLERYAYSSCLSPSLSLYQKKNKHVFILVLGPARRLKLTIRCEGAARSGEAKLERDVKAHAKGRKLISSRPTSTPWRSWRLTGMSLFISFFSLSTLFTIVLDCKLA